MRGRTAVAPALALAAVVAAATALMVWLGWRNHIVQPDEALSIIGGRAIGADVGALWDWDLIGRGPERLGAVLFAIAGAVTGSTAATLELAHVLFALCAALVAVPAYGLARGLDVRPPAAVGAAALAVLGPWAVFGATYLNTAPGTLTAALLLWAMWHALVRPGVRGDLLVVGAFVLAAGARVGNAPLVVALVPAVPLVLWHTRPRGERFGAWLRRAPGRLVQDHPILLAAGLVGLVVVVVKGQAAVLGAYGDGIGAQSLSAELLWRQARTILARTAEAFAIVPVLIAAPWLVRETVRPRSAETGAFGVLALAAFLVVVYVLQTAVVEDRYLALLGLPVAVGFVAALDRREVSVPGIVVATAVVWWCVATVGRAPDDAPFSYLVAGGAQFFDRAIVDRLAFELHLGDAARPVVLLVAAGIAIAVALFAHHRRWWVLAPLLLVAMVAVGAAGTVYAGKKWTDLATFPQRTFAQQTFVDVAARGRPVAYYANPEVETPDVYARLKELQYTNADLRGVIADAERPSTFPCCAPEPLPPIRVRLDRRSGAVAVEQGALPELYVVPLGWAPTGLAARRVAIGEPGMVLLARRPGPPRLAFAQLGGTGPDGWQTPGETTRIRVFAEPETSCARFNLMAPSVVPGGTLHVEGRTAAGSRTVDIPQGGPASLEVPLPPDRATILRVRSEPAGRFLDGRPAGVLVGDLEIAPCTG